MKTSTANLFASLIVDQWPMPAWIRARIQSHPDIADAIRSAKMLESQLGVSAKTFTLDQSVLPKVVGAGRTAISARIAIASFASAAVLLICFYGFHRSGGDSSQNMPTLAQANTTPEMTAEKTTLVDQTSPVNLSDGSSEAAKPQPILVSLAAAENVFKEISQGLQNVAGDLTDATVELGADFKVPKTSSGDTDVQGSRRSFWLGPVKTKS